MELISQLDAHAKMIELYPEYAFFLPHTSNLDRMLGKDKSIINQAENRLYLNLKKGRKGIKNICPEYGEYFNFVNYSFVKNQKKEESILSLLGVAWNGDIGKVADGKVIYQIKEAESSLLHYYSCIENVPPEFRDFIDILENIEKYLKKEIPEYFKLKTF